MLWGDCRWLSQQGELWWRLLKAVVKLNVVLPKKGDGWVRSTSLDRVVETTGSV